MRSVRTAPTVILDVHSRERWRRWLTKHHASVPAVWLVFHKDRTGPAALDYEAAVEEALCFGWIDSIIKRVDDARYVRKFTPRKPESKWSTANRRRYAMLLAGGLLAPAGLERAPTTRSGDAPRRSDTSIPDYIERAQRARPAAWNYFAGLAPSYRRQYVGWIDGAKKQETKRRRLEAALGLLEAGKKLGLK